MRAASASYVAYGFAPSSSEHHHIIEARGGGALCKRRHAGRVARLQIIRKRRVGEGRRPVSLAGEGPSSNDYANGLVAEGRRVNRQTDAASGESHVGLVTRRRRHKNQ